MANKCFSKEQTEGLPWQFSGSDITLPMQGMLVWSLVWELRSHVLCGMGRAPLKNRKINK